MKPEEKLLFETFIIAHPDFRDIKSWIPGPDPPDVIATDSRARRIGIELTEWLDKRANNSFRRRARESNEVVVGSRC